jgi:hypothetical protein
MLSRSIGYQDDFLEKPAFSTIAAVSANFVLHGLLHTGVSCAFKETATRGPGHRPADGR